jgi:hypothetical protein
LTRKTSKSVLLILKRQYKFGTKAVLQDYIQCSSWKTKAFTFKFEEMHTKIPFTSSGNAPSAELRSNAVIYYSCFVIYYCFIAPAATAAILLFDLNK